MTTLDVDNLAKITNMDGQKSRVHIDEELIANALKLKTGYFNLTNKISDIDKNTSFLTLPGMAYTYKDLVHKEVELPLQLYAQHFTLTRPVRYTKSSMRLATLFTKSLTKMLPTPNFARYILSEMHQHAASKGVKDHLIWVPGIC